MEWQDEGVILHTKKLGETKAIINLFTLSHGRCAGVLNLNRKNKNWLQCGGYVKARWSARLETHLGYWTLEPLHSNTAYLLDAPGPLAALLSATSLCQLVLPERHAYTRCYQQFKAFFENLQTSDWARAYVDFEVLLLEELGYGLDLKACAVTGQTHGLTAVSPRTGRAVSGEVAKPYQGKLLPLPAFIREKDAQKALKAKEILDALTLTGYFLERHLLGRSLPPARGRLAQWFSNGRNWDDRT